VIPQNSKVKTMQIQPTCKYIHGIGRIAADPNGADVIAPTVPSAGEQSA
jgi:hypothetical protein